MASRLLIITPLFFGDASGASVYYKTLSKLMIESGFEIGIVSDRTRPDNFPLPISYYPLFPERCGKDKRPLIDGINYLIQNFCYLSLSSIIFDFKPAVVLVHSSLFNHFGVFGVIISHLISQHRNIRFIADVRDHLLPKSQAARLNNFDSIVACSRNVVNHLSFAGVVDSKVHYIPVIQEPIHREDHKGKSVLIEFGLINTQYILFAGLVKESKGLDLLLDAFIDYVRPANPNILLVVAGLMKTTSRKMRRRLESSGVLVLGVVDRNRILNLMVHASLCINLSRSEGMPRSSLEAIALGCKVALPSDIPEFDECCKDQVISSTDPAIVASHLMDFLEFPQSITYPIEQHFPNNVLQKYISMLT